MPIALLFPILARLAGPISFASAAIVAGGMNRSVVMVPLLAVTASLATVLVRWLLPSPVNDLKAMLSPEAEPAAPNPLKGVGQRFGLGLIGYGLLFGLAALIAAVFKTTEFEPQVLSSDIWFLAVPGAIAIIGAWVSARLGYTQMAGMMGQMQTVFADIKSQQAPQPGEQDGFTFEGEIIDPEDRDS
ncbi:MAG: hypothetical protein AAFR51_02240 [Pseudomonadota bacterium]